MVSWQHLSYGDDGDGVALLELDARNVSSISILQRLNTEIRRRIKAVGSFKSVLPVDSDCVHDGNHIGLLGVKPHQGEELAKVLSNPDSMKWSVEYKVKLLLKRKTIVLSLRLWCCRQS